MPISIINFRKFAGWKVNQEEDQAQDQEEDQAQDQEEDQAQDQEEDQAQDQEEDQAQDQALASLVQVSDVLLSGNLSEENIQGHLDSATSIVKDMLGFDDSGILPDDYRIEQAVYTLALFFIENRSSQSRDFTLTTPDFLSEKKTYHYRDRLEPAIYRRVIGLINPWRRVSAFMPGVPT